MKIVILSGGSGNDALIKGLVKFYPTADIKVIVNAYDNGKSTGVCRAVTDTLGVSDIRKNHARMYKAKYGDKADPNVLEFYNNRYEFEKGKEVEQITALLNKWGMSDCVKYCVNFFNQPTACNYTYTDFSVSNIIYAQMYKEIGYEKTNKFFCDRFGINDFVVLNSFDNVFIKAKTESGHIIQDEGETVFWNNPNDKIVRTIYEVTSHYGLNPQAVDLVLNADLIVVSTGTFWSSIQPTIEYLDFYKYINASKARKIWVMNNEEDGDSWGVSDLELISHMEKSGLDLSQFTILLNSDARESMRLKDNAHNFTEMPIGNVKGKHDGNKYARALLVIYFGLDKIKASDKILLDFDDTIWARYNSDELLNASIENVKLLNEHFKDKAIIISGNSYESIHDKLAKVYSNDLADFNIDIWADANSTEFRHGKIADFIEDLVIDDEKKAYVDEIAKKYGLNILTIGQKPVNYKIKPLSNEERHKLVEAINSQYKGKFKAYATGNTTIDILSCNNSKEVVFHHCNLDNCKTVFIGDEIDKGNDESISKICTYAIKVSDALETNVLLKLLLGE